MTGNQQGLMLAWNENKFLTFGLPVTSWKHVWKAGSGSWSDGFGLHSLKYVGLHVDIVC